VERIAGLLVGQVTATELKESIAGEELFNSLISRYCKAARPVEWA
jgi:hypothetical protein